MEFASTLQMSKLRLRAGSDAGSHRSKWQDQDSQAACSFLMCLVVPVVPRTAQLAPWARPPVCGGS